MLGSLYIRVFPVPFEQVLIVAAMAAIMAAANKTLLTSVAFVAETAGPSSIIFTLTAAATSYFISRDSSFYSHVQPIDEFSDEEEALHVLYRYIIKKKDPLGLHEVKASDFMNREPVVLKENMKIKEALECVQACNNTEYPIIRRNKVIGVTTLDNLLTFPERKHRLQIGLLPMDRPHVIEQHVDFEEAIEEFLATNASCLWVVEDMKSMKLVGMITEEEFRVKLMALL
jgi:CBS domain-containing protein